MRRLLCIGLGVVLLVSLGGWVAIGFSGGTIAHVRSAADASAALARATMRQPGVAAASAGYSPFAGTGETVRVAVTMRTTATVAEWSAATMTVRTRLLAPALAAVHQSVRITGAGAGGADLRFEDAGDWPSRATVQGWFDRWRAAEQAAGVPLRLVRSAQTGTQPGLRAGSAAATLRVVARLAEVGPALGGAFLQGYGLSIATSAPHGVATVYRALLRTHEPTPPNAVALPSRPTGTVFWSRAGAGLALAAPRTQAAPSNADARVAAVLWTALGGRGARSVTWTNGTAAASIASGRCASGRWAASAQDRAFAALVNARQTHTRVHAGSCAP